MILETKGISKQFGEEYAVQDIDFSIEEGEVHGLVGENGAGKSTLIKILTGVYHMDVGEIWWKGSLADINNPLDSKKLGINVIHQDRHLIPAFNGIENIYLGLEYEKKSGVAIDWNQMKQKVTALMKELSIEVPLNVPARELSPPQKTLIEILRAMMIECKLLILDEPTASLSDKEVEILFGTIQLLRKRGTAILYVTHRMDEIFELTQRVTVFKNGRLVQTLPTRETDVTGLVSLMTDQWKSNKVGKSYVSGEPLLEVKGIKTKEGIVKDASFTAHRGQVLGIFGLGGSGRTELLEAVYGYRASLEGEVVLYQEPYVHRTPPTSIQKGMVLISEDRRGKALITSFTVKNNITISLIDKYARYGVMNQHKEVRDTNESIRGLGIKTKGHHQVVAELSGGNQQKVVFAKSMLSNPKVYLCDEPTQAVDVKTREEIHNLLKRKAAEGNAVVFVSSDLKELLDVADHIQVIREGVTTVCLENQGLTTEEVLSHCYA